LYEEEENMRKIIAIGIALSLLGPLSLAAWAQDEPAAEAAPEKTEALENASEAEDTKKAPIVVKHHHEEAWMPAVLVPLGLFSCIVLVVVFSLYYRSRRTREIHGTLRAMVEKGAEIPPDLLTPPIKPDGDLRKGIIYLASGSGWILFALFFFPHVNGGPEVEGLWSIGAIPGMIGLGYLLIWYLRRNKKE
jgi:hypothetical protein